MGNRAIRTLVVLLLAISVALTAAVPCSASEEKKLEVRASDTMGDLLTKLAGSPVELTLRNGTVLSGKLALVQQHLLVLSSLKGREFYDAVIRVDDVSAVIVRMRDR